MQKNLNFIEENKDNFRIQTLLKARIEKYNDDGKGTANETISLL